MTGNGESSRRNFLNRREFLALGTGSIGAAAAAWYGLRPRSGREISGSIVGASRELGHRLRSGPLPPPDEIHEVPVVIAGGGIAGLSAGWKLHRSGIRDFTLLELEETVGGNSRSGENDTSAYPWAAHYVPVPNRDSKAVRELFEELGIIVDYQAGRPVCHPRYLCHAPQERLYQYGRWIEGLFPRQGMTPNEFKQVNDFDRTMTRYRNLKDKNGRPAFTIPIERCSRAPDLLQLDLISMREYMDQKGWNSTRLRWYVDYCCRDDYGCTLETTSAWAGIHYFSSREVADPEVLTWPEGNGWLVNGIRKRISGQIQTRALVHRITPDGDQINVDFIDVRKERSIRYRAKHVVFSLPRFTARYVMPEVPLSGSQDYSYAPWMVANITVDRLPDESHWDNVLFGSPSLGYVTSTHQNLRMPGGPSVLTYYQPMSDLAPREARKLMVRRPWESWRDSIVGDLKRAHPEINETISNIDVMLLAHAMIRPTPGFIWGKGRMAAGTGSGNIRFAHSDMSGISIFEEAQFHGIRAAEEILDDLGVPYSSSLG